MSMDFVSSRSFALTLARRAVHDVKRDGFRQLRNYVDMCSFLATRPAQKYFFDEAQQILQKTDSLYYDLIRRMVDRVSEDRIVTVGVNLAYDSLVYGTTCLRRGEAEGKPPRSWFTLASDHTPEPEKAAAQAEAAGSYFWIMALHGPVTPQTAALCKNHPYSAFALLGEPACFDAAAVDLLADCPNAVPVLHLSQPEMTPEAGAAARRMQEKKLLFGFLTELDEQTAADAFQPVWLDVLSSYSLFCVCARRPGMSAGTSAELHRQIVSGRRDTVAMPLLLLDWEEDLRWLTARATPNAPACLCLPVGESFPLAVI